MHYSNNENSVRIDFFKPSGKWYKTEAMEWIGFNGYIHDEFKQSLINHVGSRELEDMLVVCLSPYNKNEHPLMINLKNVRY